MASPHQEPDDQFLRLSDDVVLLIINKLLLAETLIRVSLVSKRFFSLVFQSDSVFVDLDLCDRPSFLGRLFGFFKRFVTRSIPNPNNSQNLYAILRRFRQIKRLQVHLSVDSAPKSLESGAFFRWIAAFGSHFECLNLIIAKSVNQSNPPPVDATGINVTQGLNDELSAHTLKFVAYALKVASGVHDMIREHVLGREEMLESVAVSTDYGKVVMGKEEIARLRSSGSSRSSNHFQGVWDGSYVPTLHLLELGYTMKDVVFVRADYIEEKLAVMDDAFLLDDVEMRYVPHLGDSERKKWEVYDEVVRVFLKNMKLQ